MFVFESIDNNSRIDANLYIDNSAQQDNKKIEMMSKIPSANGAPMYEQ